MLCFFLGSNQKEIILIDALWKLILYDHAFQQLSLVLIVSIPISPIWHIEHRGWLARGFVLHYKLLEDKMISSFLSSLIQLGFFRFSKRLHCNEICSLCQRFSTHTAVHLCLPQYNAHTRCFKANSNSVIQAGSRLSPVICLHDCPNIKNSYFFSSTYGPLQNEEMNSSAVHFDTFVLIRQLLIRGEIW